MTLIAVGERAPDFALPRHGSDPTRFYGIAGGRPTTVLFGDTADTEHLTATVAALRDALGSEHPIHIITPSPDVAARLDGFHDPDGGVHRAYGVPQDAGPVMVLTDPNLRVLLAGRSADPRRDAGRAAEVARQASADAADAPGHRAPRHAPVLQVPNALPPDLCQRLLEVWEQDGARETGVEAGGAEGRAAVVDAARKRRRDHTVEDPDLLRQLTRVVGSRIMPELQHAFAYRADRFEGFKIGCYEAEDTGFFEAHRDNLSPATAHRRFGLTLNLNDGYEGGELRFPEYGPQRYRPDAGEALVFSGSLLHEVLPVTRGRRFVLLSFVFAGRSGAASHRH